MPGTVVVGTQWGDEGKGRLVDVFAKEHAVVVRYQGGHNAGHTLVVDGESFALQLVPSGVLYDHVTPVIGNGVVVDPEVLLDEVDGLDRRGVDTSRLRLSPAAHVVLDHHRVLDGLAEDRRGDDAIGTTRRGIGPAYADKANRVGVRVEDLLDADTLRARLTLAAQDKRALLAAAGLPPLDVAALVERYLPVAERIRPLVADTVAIVNEALEAGEWVLFEGAQATFLDLDHGTYPYVTSSNPVAGAAAVGGGVGPRCIARVVGLAKAYVTRVGHGPFPTELTGPLADHLVETGHEYGTNTGRRRRVGWFDTVLARQAVRLNSLSELALTKLDVLDGLDEVGVCTAYEVDGRRVRHLPATSAELERARPVVERVPGWSGPVSGARHPGDLPAAALDYVRFLQAEVGVPVGMVSVGPGRDQYLQMSG